MIRAGKLDRRVTIRTRVMTQNAYGEQALTYTDLATVYAEVTPVSGREMFMAAAVYADASIKVRIRYRADFDETAKVVIDGVAYDITHIADQKRQNERILMVKKP